MKFRITEDHINEGISATAGSCPVALCVKRAGFAFVSVGNVYINVNLNEYRLPQKVISFIQKFDDLGRKGVKPMEFTIKGL